MPATAKMALQPNINEIANDSLPEHDRFSFAAESASGQPAEIMASAASHSYNRVAGLLPLWLIAIMAMTIVFLIIAINNHDSTGIGVMSTALITGIVAFAISMPNRARDKE